MVSTTIGILSDTHLSRTTKEFKKQCAVAFNGCDIIIHAGDLTDLSLLSAFPGKTIYGVHGNMCSLTAQQYLPEKREVTIEGFSIGICHGYGPRHNIEERMLDLFPGVDCIVYGHTHQPVCHLIGKTLIINPGSFQATGRYGAPGTYGLLIIEPNGLRGSILELP
ncbi:metallophosphoesterase family protein [Desulfomarina sp.]